MNISRKWTVLGIPALIIIWIGNIAVYQSFF